MKTLQDRRERERESERGGLEGGGVGEEEYVYVPIASCHAFHM